MAIKVGGTTVINDSKKGIFETVNPGQYTTANRPSNPVEGDVIFDTDEKGLYVWNGTEWVASGTGGSFTPPALANNVLTQDQVNANRFTGNSFTSTLTNTGGEATDCLMTATVTGTLAIEAGTQPITTNAYPGTSSTEVELTLEGAANLGGGVFEVDDIVKANESYTPTTSLIAEFENKVYTDGTIVAPAACVAVDENGTTLTVNGPWNDDYLNYWFDGTEVSYSGPGGAGGSNAISYTFANPIPIGSSLEISIVKGGSNPNGGTFKVNGTDVMPQLSAQSSTAGLPHKFTITGFSELSSLMCNNIDAAGGYAYIAAIYIDGEILTNDGKVITLPDETDIALFQAGDVVQGNIYTSETWSSLEFSLGGYGEPYNSDKAFNGVINDYNDGWYAAAGSYIEFTPNLKGISTIKIYAASGGTGGTLLVNGNPVSLDQGLNGTSVSTYVISASEFTSLRHDRPDGVNFTGINGIEVDGNLLIDGNDPIYKVTATDVSARTITVDGGTWDTSNQSQIWSDSTISGTVYGGYSWEDVFNGTITGGPGPGTTVIQANEGFTQIDFTGFSSISSVKVVYYGGTGGQIYLNYGESSQQLHAATTVGIIGEGVQPSHTFTASDLVNIRLSNTGSDNFPYLYAIYVDDKLLVDAVNDSQVWSAGANKSHPSYPITNGFDGDQATIAYSEAGDPILITFNPAVSISSSLDIWANHVGTNNDHLIINGTSVANSLSSSSTAIAKDTFTQFTELSTLQIGSNAQGNNYVGFSKVAIDGKVLIDQGVRDLGDNKVSTVNAKQGSGTISDITGTQVTITPFTDNCFKETQHLVHVTPKTVLVNPKTDAISNIAGNVLTFTGDKDLYQFANGDPVYMCNADGSTATVKFTTDTISNVEFESAWNQDEDWSSCLTSTSGVPVELKSQAFNGTPSAGSSTSAKIDGSDSPMIFTPPTPIAFTTSIRIYGGSNSDDWRVQTDDGYSEWVEVDSGNWTTIFAGSGRVITIEGRETTGTNACRLGAIEIDGRQLVDPGVNNSSAGLTSNNVLTFNSATNLTKFKSGDILDGINAATVGVQKYTGNGSTKTVEGFGFSPDLVWLKARTNGGANHGLFDTARGATKRLISNSNGGESTQSSSLTNFTSDGFTLGSDSAYNANSGTCVAWCWDAGDGSYVTNTDGGITASVKSNPTSGFAIAKWDGDVGTTIGHGLGATPKFVITKSYTTTNNWAVYHSSLGTDKVLALDTTSGGQTVANYWGSPSDWNNSTFGVYATGNANNNIGGMVAYIWAEVPGGTKIGSYEGNGSSTGPVVDCGFEPAYLLIKKAGSDSWIVYDKARNTSSPFDTRLTPNTSDAETTGTNIRVNYTATGFQPAASGSTINNSGQTYLFVAFSSGSDVVKVIGAPDVANQKMTVNSPVFSQGDTVSVTKSGAGTVDSKDVTAQTLTLKDDNTNNQGWADGYYVATPEKPASSTKGYVRFDSNGTVECIESFPLPAVNMQNKVAPKLTFPEEFECVQSPPDTELGASTFLQTEVTLKSVIGESTKKSNALTPQTTTYSVAAGYAALNTTEYAESAAKIKNTV